MATAVISPMSVELFYSYSHLDEALCRELQKHLTSLKRSGLIYDWYDRRIEPGSRWAVEIQQAMERARIILLLISADFLASQYIFEIELPFALARHSSGQATVIPVLLRPVEWRDSPIAKLQVLPSHARPVTLWPNQDEAFSDVAGGLREFLYNRRLKEARRPPTFDAATATAAQERVLDAAVSSTLIKDEPTDLVVMIRTSESGGLRGILKIDRRYSPLMSDVQSKTFELDFPVDSSGKIFPVALALVLESPGCYPPKQMKQLRVPAEGDSDVSVFMLTPTKVGMLRVSLQLLSGEVEIGSSILITTSISAESDQTSPSYVVTSLDIKTSTKPKVPDSFDDDEPGPDAPESGADHGGQSAHAEATSNFCNRCGSPNRDKAIYCKGCGSNLAGSSAAASSPAFGIDPRVRAPHYGADSRPGSGNRGAPTGVYARGKSALVALFLSLLIPGVGQLYNGDPKRAIPMLLIGVFGYVFALLPIFGVFLVLGIHIWSMINAYNVASGKTPLA